MNKEFALIGAAGYIAPRHMKAIKETGNNLRAGFDPFDSVGILDSYFPDAAFFTELEQLDTYLNRWQAQGNQIDYISICSPNYLHNAHVRFALNHDCDAICEKPLTLTPDDLEALELAEKQSSHKINNILQLRMHPALVELKKKIEQDDADKVYEVDLAYITSRGAWYHRSWKGDEQKSGGVVTNIGVHFFDMLGWLFGEVTKNQVHLAEDATMAGYLEFKQARVRWFLSVDANNLPDEIKEKSQRTYRSITIGGEEIEFSGGFTDLHTLSYQEILKGNGFGIDKARQAIETVYQVRQLKPLGLQGDYHPLLKEAASR